MKKAMSMIELVISIVVMGIVVAGIPMILQRTQGSSVINAVRQENILIAKTQLWRILSYDWAPNSFNSIDQKAYVLRTNGNADFEARAGFTGLSGRRRFDPAGPVVAIAIAGVGNVTNIRSIDGFDGLGINITTSGKIDAASSDAGKLDYTTKDAAGNAIAISTATVTYFNDAFAGINFNNNTHDLTLSINPTAAPPAGTSNIKIITETVNTGLDIDGDAVNESITMYGFASNVGQSLDIDPRTF